MPFHLCPMSFPIQRLFKPLPGAFYRPRLTITERARQLIGQAPAASGNSFEIEQGFKEFPSALQQAVLRHFDLAFTGQKILIEGDRGQDGQPIVTVELLGQSKVLLSLLFRISQEFKAMQLAWIKSDQPGSASRALPALYNIARELQLEKIYFIVNPTNANARRVYFHLDFGRPVMDRGTTWEVEVS